jgi:hypothetical protein
MTDTGRGRPKKSPDPIAGLKKRCIAIGVPEGWYDYFIEEEHVPITEVELEISRVLFCMLTDWPKKLSKRGSSGDWPIERVTVTFDYDCQNINHFLVLSHSWWIMGGRRGRRQRRSRRRTTSTITVTARAWRRTLGHRVRLGVLLWKGKGWPLRLGRGFPSLRCCLGRY